MRLRLLLIAVALVVAVSAPGTAWAKTDPIATAAYGLGYCGPAVQSLSQTIQFYNSPAGRPMARAVEGYVRAHSGYYGIHADQSFGAWLSTLKVVTAPAGYRITSNTYCPNGSSIAPYHGHYAVGGLKMLAVVRHGKLYPVFKGYCRNVVMGPPMRKVRKHHKHKAKPKPVPSISISCPVGTVKQVNSQGQIVCQVQVVVPTNTCPANQVKDSNGNCVNQTNQAQQNCEAKGGTFNGDTQLCTIIQINANCSNVIVLNGSGNVVSSTQGDNCTTQQPPPPPPQSPPSIVSITILNDVDAGGNSPNFCATVDMPGSDTGTLIMSPTYGSFGSPGTATFTVSGSAKVCSTYFAPTEVPPGGNDTITVTLRDDATGLSANPKSTTFAINPPPTNPG